MDLPTYTNIWRIEKRLYKLYDLRLPMPLPLVQIGVCVGVFVPWTVLLHLIGLPFATPWHVVYLVPPLVVTVLATRPVIEGKRLTELLLSQARYLTEPRTWARLTPIREPEEVVVTVKVWRRGGQPALATAGRAARTARRRGRARQAESVQIRAAARTAGTALRLHPTHASAPQPLAEQLPVREPETRPTSWSDGRLPAVPAAGGDAAVPVSAGPVDSGVFGSAGATDSGASGDSVAAGDAVAVVESVASTRGDAAAVSAGTARDQVGERVRERAVDGPGRVSARSGGPDERGHAHDASPSGEAEPERAPSGRQGAQEPGAASPEPAEWRSMATWPPPAPTPGAARPEDPAPEDAGADGSGKRGLASGVRRPGAAADFWRAIAPPPVTDDGPAAPAQDTPQDPAVRSTRHDSETDAAMPTTSASEGPEPIRQDQAATGTTPGAPRHDPAAVPGAPRHDPAGGAGAAGRDRGAGRDAGMATTRPDIPMQQRSAPVTRPDIPVIPGAFGAGGRRPQPEAAGPDESGVGGRSAPPPQGDRLVAGGRADQRPAAEQPPAPPHPTRPDMRLDDLMPRRGEQPEPAGPTGPERPDAGARPTAPQPPDAGARPVASQPPEAGARAAAQRSAAPWLEGVPSQVEDAPAKGVPMPPPVDLSRRGEPMREVRDALIWPPPGQRRRIPAWIQQQSVPSPRPTPPAAAATGGAVAGRPGPAGGGGTSGDARTAAEIARSWRENTAQDDPAGRSGDAAERQDGEAARTAEFAVPAAGSAADDDFVPLGQAAGGTAEQGAERAEAAGREGGERSADHGEQSAEQDDDARRGRPESGRDVGEKAFGSMPPGDVARSGRHVAADRGGDAAAREERPAPRQTRPDDAAQGRPVLSPKPWPPKPPSVPKPGPQRTSDPVPPPAPGPADRPRPAVPAARADARTEQRTDARAEGPAAPVRSGPASPVRPRHRPLMPPEPPPAPESSITPPDAEQEAAGGLRRLLQAVGGGGGQIDAEYEERLQRPFQGTRRIVVLGCTGGAGQTVTGLMLGHTFAQYCGEPVVAIDVNPGATSLSRRTRSETPETLTGLIARADQVHSLTAMRRYTSSAKSGLDIIAAGKNPLQALDDRDYAVAIRTLDRFYSLTLLDAAAAVVARVLSYADQIVLVAPASADAPRAVGMTFEWLDGHGHTDLRSRAVTVINGVSRRSLDDVVQAEAVARGRCRALVRIPWDDHLSLDRAPRNELKALRAPTRRAYLALAGVVAGGFTALPERYEQENQARDQVWEQEMSRE